MGRRAVAFARQQTGKLVARGDGIVVAGIEAAGVKVNTSNPATSATARPNYDHLVIRNCNTPQEFESCVDMQRDVWKFTDEDLVPMRMFVVAHKIGGQVIGAFDGDKMIAFALGIPGNR